MSETYYVITAERTLYLRNKGLKLEWSFNPDESMKFKDMESAKTVQKWCGGRIVHVKHDIHQDDDEIINQMDFTEDREV